MNKSELILRLVRGTDDYVYAFADRYLTVMNGRTGQVVRFDVERDEVAFIDKDYDSSLAVLLKEEAEELVGDDLTIDLGKDGLYDREEREAFLTECLCRVVATTMREGAESSGTVLADEVVALFVIDDNEERRTVRVLSAKGLEDLRRENPGHEHTYRALIRAQKQALEKEEKLGSRHLPVVYFSGQQGLPRERFDTCGLAVFVADVERMRSWLDGPTTS